MNAAFLLVASACLVGQTPPATTPAPAPVVSTVVPGGCGSTACSSCETSCGHKLFGGKLAGLFSRSSSCDGGCSTCGTTTHTWGGGHTCGLFARFKHSYGTSCDGGCSSCASGSCAPSVTTPTPAPTPAGEIINTPPKKMPPPPAAPPKAPPVAPKTTSTFGPAPTLAPTTIAPPATSAPIIEVVPPPAVPAVPAVPSVTNQPRSPF